MYQRRETPREAKKQGEGRDLEAEAVAEEGPLFELGISDLAKELHLTHKHTSVIYRSGRHSTGEGGWGRELGG